MAVPCLDLSWLPEDGEPAQEALDALDEAFGPDGLGLICLVGDEAFRARVAQLRGSLLPLAQRLAQLPAAQVELIQEEGTRNVNNFSRGVDGNRSGFYFHPVLDAPGEALPAGVDVEATFYTPSRWPEELPELRREARAHAPWLVRLGRSVAQAVDRRCAQMLPGYEPGILERLVAPAETCNHKCRLICYHDFDSAEERVAAKGMWAPPHKDTGLLTLLVPGIFLDGEGQQKECPDKEVGLYVRDRRGKISQIQRPDVECLYVQVGEALQIVSGGLYHATEHCVRAPPSHGRGYERASLAVFFQPHAHEELPLPGVSMQEVANRAYDGLFRMFLHYQPKDATGINFLRFCQREGF